LEINGEAIYESSPWVSQNDTFNGSVWYTCRKDNYDSLNPIAKPKGKVTVIYAMFLKWPVNNNTLIIADITKYLTKGNWKVTMLGNEHTPLHVSILYFVTN
jgi:hypothetical protein